MKRSYTVYQVDAFTKEKLSGNPAGVVLDARGLSDEEMRRIARELNNSETAFLLPGTPGESDVHIRFFTPTQEDRYTYRPRHHRLPLCPGHGAGSGQRPGGPEVRSGHFPSGCVQRERGLPGGHVPGQGPSSGSPCPGRIRTGCWPPWA